MKIFVLALIFFSTLSAETSKSESKALICGVCRNVAQNFERTVENIETLGSRFSEYHVIIYENNSTDGTPALFKEWAKNNENITFLSENLPANEIPPCRTEKIARARNIVLTAARDKKFADFTYLIMADLDSACVWPFDEVINTVRSPKEWDCVAANDLYLAEGFYRDRYAFRGAAQPLGPEIVGDAWWGVLNTTWFVIDQGDWLPVFSAFGGLAIYKTKSILPFNYFGTVTEDLSRYYEYILSLTDRKNPYKILYLGVLAKEKIRTSSQKPAITFHHNTSSERPANYPYVTVCEHVTLHAAMAMHGHGKLYINPKMKVRFN